MTGHMEWIIIGGVVLLLFGASALPKLARSLGRAKQEFQKGVREGARTDLENSDQIDGQDENKKRSSQDPNADADAENDTRVDPQSDTP